MFNKAKPCMGFLASVNCKIINRQIVDINFLSKKNPGILVLTCCFQDHQKRTK